jgi:Cu2+-exporting ATPase
MKIAIYSGDMKENVTHLARQLKIKDFFWEVSPEEKFKKIQNLQMTNNNVLMIGDGLNDGPALTQSNVSIAMGLAPSVVQSKSDFIIINNNLSLIKTVIQLSKKVIRVIKQNMIWAVLYNLTMIPFAFMGMIEPWIAGLGMSLSSLVVVLNSYRINL